MPIWPYGEKNDRISAACKLCGERQTLCHILNNCRTALEQQMSEDVVVIADLEHQYQLPTSLAFTDLHPDLVAYSFAIISKFMKKQMSEDVVIIADLEHQYQFPTSLAFTDLRTDLVAYSCLAKTAIIVELTVCYLAMGITIKLLITSVIVVAWLISKCDCEVYINDTMIFILQFQYEPRM